MLFLSFSVTQDSQIAYSHIRKLKNGVLLVRLHAQDAIIEKMRYYHRDIERPKKIKEIYENNMLAYMALTTAYDFSEIRFFFGRESRKVLDEDYKNIFLDSKLEIDTTISIPDSVPIYILDVGDIYFPNMSGHQE
jgi:hypothetical protein